MARSTWQGGFISDPGLIDIRKNKNSIAILLIEDNLDDVRILQEVLPASGPLCFEIIHAGRLAEGLARLDQGGIDVVLLDLGLPDSNGIETLSRTTSHSPDIPIVALTGNADEELGCEAIRLGAQDYLVKGRVFGKTLIRSIRYAIERKRSRRELEGSLSLLHATLDSTTDGILVVNRSGKIVTYNQKFVEMWRIPPYIIGLRDDDYALQFVFDQLKDPGKFLAKVKDLYEHEDAESFDVLEFKDGRIFERYSRSQRVGDKSVGRVWSFRDVTKPKQLERLKDEFISVIAHELKTPLTIFKGTISNLIDEIYGPLQERQTTAVVRMELQCQRLEKIITNLLDLSRLESGRAKINRRMVDPIGLVQESVQTFGSMAQARKISLKQTLPPSVPRIHADPDMLGQVLMNLLSNACRYAKGEVEVVLKIEDEAVMVKVIDDGPGISPEHLESIFDKYEQINRPTGGNGYKGTGLGLAICKEIIAQHNGKIWAASRPGEGSRFYFTLPIQTD